jgi:zinc protease
MVVAGDVKPDQVKKLVEKYFGWIPKGADPKRPLYKQPAPITKEIVINTTDDVQVPRVHLSWRAPVAFSAEQPALDIASVILGDGKSSRLYKRLVYDEKIAQDVRVYYSSEEIGGELRIIATAKPGTDSKRLIKEIGEEVEKLAKTEPTAKELERAQNAYEAAFLNGLEPTLQRAIKLAEYDVMAKDPDYFGKDLARYRGVTAAQVKDVVAKYLKPNARVVLTIAPGKKVVK